MLLPLMVLEDRKEREKHATAFDGSGREEGERETCYCL